MSYNLHKRLRESNVYGAAIIIKKQRILASMHGYICYDERFYDIYLMTRPPIN
jgi:hypothetical protein